MIVVVDCDTGNTGSILNMIRRIGADVALSRDRETIRSATKLILPGVGSFDRAMSSLLRSGLLPALEARVLQEGVPILGICLGMQLFASRSAEGNAPGLGWINAHVERLRVGEGCQDLKIPHMGWNTLDVQRPSPLFRGLDEGSRFYFVHSYHIVCAHPDDVLALTTHGEPFVSAVGRGNILGVQFHPEKSHRFGVTLLRNFVEST